jgi:5-methylcytosine-specific restriction endonuclease McrA
MSRSEFSRKTRLAIIKRADGKCEACKAVLKPKEGEVDHILPCALGGDNSPANGRLLCRVCHTEKTASDVRRTRKADRQRDKNNGAWKPPSKKMTGRGFTKTDKPRKIDKKGFPPLGRPGLARQIVERNET